LLRAAKALLSGPTHAVVTRIPDVARFSSTEPARAALRESATHAEDCAWRQGPSVEGSLSGHWRQALRGLGVAAGRIYTGRGLTGTRCAQLSLG